MNVHPIADRALGNTSYLVEAGDGIAVSIDPRRDIDEHLALAKDLDLEIAGVIETHLHADFVGGSRELAAVTGARIYAAAEAAMQGPHEPVAPGAEIGLGAATFRFLATPGHTPEHMSAVMTVGGEPSLFSGGALIVGGVARTDLSGSDRTEELARAQFRSLRSFDALPDRTPLYPTHGAGSFCSSGPARSSTSTIGAERTPGSLFAITDEDGFVKTLLAGYGSYPRYFAHLREINQEGAPLLADLASIEQLTPEQAQASIAGGAWLIDGRKVATWAQEHPVGAVSIQVRDAFASWLGWVVPFGEPFVLVIAPEQLEKATKLSRRIGYDRLEGWLTFESWRDAGLPVSSVQQIDPDEAARRASDGATLLDVRQDSEFAISRIPDAVHIELGDLIAGAKPEGSKVITYCGHGERSATAASLLERAGVEVADLRGGIQGWQAAGSPVRS